MLKGPKTIIRRVLEAAETILSNKSLRFQIRILNDAVEWIKFIEDLLKSGPFILIQHQGNNLQSFTNLFKE